MPSFSVSTLELETKRLSKILESLKDEEEKVLSLLKKNF